MSVENNDDNIVLGFGDAAPEIVCLNISGNNTSEAKDLPPRILGLTIAQFVFCVVAFLYVSWLVSSYVWEKCFCSKRIKDRKYRMMAEGGGCRRCSGRCCRSSPAPCCCPAPCCSPSPCCSCSAPCCCPAPPRRASGGGSRLVRCLCCCLPRYRQGSDDKDDIEQPCVVDLAALSFQGPASLQDETEPKAAQSSPSPPADEDQEADGQPGAAAPQEESQAEKEPPVPQIYDPLSTDMAGRQSGAISHDVKGVEIPLEIIDRPASCCQKKCPGSPGERQEPVGTASQSLILDQDLPGAASITAQSSSQREFSTGQASSSRGSFKDQASYQRGPVDEKSAFEKGSNTDRMTFQRRSIRDQASLQSGSSRNRASSLRGSIKKQTSSERSSNIDRPSLQRDASMDRSSFQRGSAKEQTSSERSSNIDRTSFQRGASMDRSSSQRGSVKEQTSSERGSNTDRSSFQRGFSVDRTSFKKGSSAEQSPLTKHSSLQHSIDHQHCSAGYGAIALPGDNIQCNDKQCTACNPRKAEGGSEGHNLKDASASRQQHGHSEALVHQRPAGSVPCRQRYSSQSPSRRKLSDPRQQYSGQGGPSRPDLNNSESQSDLLTLFRERLARDINQLPTADDVFHGDDFPPAGQGEPGDKEASFHTPPPFTNLKRFSPASSARSSQRSVSSTSSSVRAEELRGHGSGEDGKSRSPGQSGKGGAKPKRRQRKGSHGSQSPESGGHRSGSGSSSPANRQFTRRRNTESELQLTQSQYESSRQRSSSVGAIVRPLPPLDLRPAELVYPIEEATHPDDIGKDDSGEDEACGGQAVGGPPAPTGDSTQRDDDPLAAPDPEDKLETLRRLQSHSERFRAQGLEVAIPGQGEQTMEKPTSILKQERSP